MNTPTEQEDRYKKWLKERVTHVGDHLITYAIVGLLSSIGIGTWISTYWRTPLRIPLWFVVLCVVLYVYTFIAMRLVVRRLNKELKHLFTNFDKLLAHHQQYKKDEKQRLVNTLGKMRTRVTQRTLAHTPTEDEVIILKTLLKHDGHESNTFVNLMPSKRLIAEVGIQNLINCKFIDVKTEYYPANAISKNFLYLTHKAKAFLVSIGVKE